jgi:hypothetical protein
MRQSYIVGDVILCLGVVDWSGLASISGDCVAGLKRLARYPCSLCLWC